MRQSKAIIIAAFIIAVHVTDSVACKTNMLVETNLTAHAPNNGTYTRTSSFVTIYTESGHRKGMYSVYLHYGNRYIDFNNTWVCIQGKSRFFYNGNWYVIK